MSVTVVSTTEPERAGSSFILSSNTGITTPFKAADRMFTKIANIYQANLEKTIKRVLALFEPVMILIMFVVVGFIVAAMLMAVTSLSTSSF